MTSEFKGRITPGAVYLKVRHIMVPVIMLTCLCQVQLKAQTKSTYETQVVFVINKSEPKTIASLMLFDSGSKQLAQSSNYQDYYLIRGTFSGKYRQKSQQILPLSGASLVMLTEQPLDPNYDWTPDKYYSRGDKLKFEPLTALVTSINKGEINIKIQ